jgi:hypothetical protein
LSLALDPISVNDLDAGATGPTITEPLVIQPERIAAIRIFNNSPFNMKINNLPGIQQVWLSPYTEETYVSSNDSSAMNRTVLGTLSITPFNFAIRNNDTQPIFTPTPYKILVTVYELGDSIPPPILITHGQMVSVVGEVLPVSMTEIANSTFTNGAAGSVTIAGADLVVGNTTIPYYTVLAGISIDFTNNATQHNFTITIAGVLPGGANISIEPNVPVGSFGWYRTLYWRSDQAGLANNANFITVSVGAISSGPTYTITIWGYGERLP